MPRRARKAVAENDALKLAKEKADRFAYACGSILIHRKRLMMRFVEKTANQKANLFCGFDIELATA